MSDLTPTEHGVGLKLLGGVDRCLAEDALNNDRLCQQIARDVTPVFEVLAPLITKITVQWNEEAS